MEQQPEGEYRPYTYLNWFFSPSKWPLYLRRCLVIAFPVYIVLYFIVCFVGLFALVITGAIDSALRLWRRNPD